MEPFESDTQSFIVKIWLEETETKDGPATWRGHITHVPGGERRYLACLGDIPAFITPYLAAMGVALSPWQQLKCWIRRKRV